MTERELMLTGMERARLKPLLLLKLTLSLLELTLPGTYSVRHDEELQ